MLGIKKLSYVVERTVSIRTVFTMLVLNISLLVCGCGGSESPSTPPPGGISLPPPVATPPQVAPKPVPKKVTKKKEKQTQAEVIDPTSNDYMIMKPPGETVIPPENVPEQNLFAVIAPVDDSSLLVVEEPQQEESVGQPNQDHKLRLPAGFAVAPNSPVNQLGFPERIICEGDGSEMVFMEAGVFTRGSKNGPANVQPQQQVFISPFYIDTHEITVAQFTAFRVDFNESATKVEQVKAPLNAAQGASYPALGILWRDAENYAKENGKALPTESEWERAARGLKSNQYPWGNGRPLASGESLDDVLPIGSRATDLTPTGLYDMAGNAREWTADWYSANLYEKQAAKGNSLIRNPPGPRLPDKLGEKSTRGSQSTWSLWMRGHANLRESGENVGFRCILRITDEMNSGGEN